MVDSLINDIDLITGGEAVEGEGQTEVNIIIEKIEAQKLSEENNGGG